MHIDPPSARPLAPHIPAAPLPRPTPPAAAAPRTELRAPVARDTVELSPGIPAEPPDEVLEQIGAAARAYEELHNRGRELRFGHDSRSGQLVIEVRDLDGRVLQRIPPTEALAVASGSFR